MSKEVARAT
jgi:hypothetical protein